MDCKIYKPIDPPDSKWIIITGSLFKIIQVNFCFASNLLILARLPRQNIKLGEVVDKFINHVLAAKV